MENSIYLDNAASTSVDARVLEAMLPYLKNSYGNPSSVHQRGKHLKVLVEDARDCIADFLGVKSKEIFVTSGGTEANNFAIKGLAFANLNSDKKHIISSTIEHPAVYDTVNYLEKFGFENDFIKPDNKGFTNADSVRERITDKTLLVSVMHANNELGSVNDVKTIAELCKTKNILFHSDTVQSIGKIVFSPKELGMDFMTVSAHKIYGPKGTGLLFVDENVKIDKYIHGGGQERDLRGGTENAAGIAGLMKSFELLKSEISDDISHYKKLKEHCHNGLKKSFGDNVIFNSDGDNFLPNIINVTFNHNALHVPQGLLPVMLDLKRIAVSGGSACASGSLSPSKVLLEIGMDEKTAQSSIRISVGKFNTTGDLDYLISALVDIMKV
ncbi:MAG: cysteine desulfurase [Ignavibacteria bacterium]|nr:cysteine desulfurase [Ignavibacteria bacterium]